MEPESFAGFMVCVFAGLIVAVLLHIFRVF